ncbi:hypothetical protein, partial [Streptomyces sp. NPDC005407]|uniref:hypothetical protein n=1 Tax=Streptomyces sp. NPDC005407 TaxID=3155340 RepID=UPI00339FBE22
GTLSTLITLGTLLTGTLNTLSALITLRTLSTLITLGTLLAGTLNTLSALITLRTLSTLEALRAPGAPGAYLALVLVLVAVAVRSRCTVRTRQSHAVLGAGPVDGVSDGRRARDNIEHYGNGARRNQRGGFHAGTSVGFTAHQRTFPHGSWSDHTASVRTL